MVTVTVDRRPGIMGEIKWIVAPEIRMPEEIEIPSFVAEGVRVGLEELETLVRKDRPEALVVILRKAALLEGAISKRLSEIPMIEAAIGRRFMGRYRNSREAAGFTPDEDSGGKPIIDSNDYIAWLKNDGEAIVVAEKLRADLRRKGIIYSREIVGVDDSSNFGFTKEFTWPTIAKMAFGEMTVTPLVNVCKGEKFDWLSEIIKLNFGKQTGFTRMFLNEVAAGRFYGNGQPFQNEADLRRMESFLREVHLQYQLRAEGDIVFTSKTADYLITLHERIETALAKIA